MHKNYKAAFLIVLLMTTVVPNVEAISSEREMYYDLGVAEGVVLGVGFVLTAPFIIGSALRWVGETDADLNETAQQVQEVSEEEAILTSIGAGVVTVFVVGGSCYQIMGRAFDLKTYDDKCANLFLSASLGLFFGEIIGMMTHKQLMEKTQQHRLQLTRPQRLQRWLTEVEKNDVIIIDSPDDQDFLKCIREYCQKNSLSLVAIHNDLQKFAESLQSADDILVLEGGFTYEEESAARRRIHELLDLINQRIVLVEQQPEYAEELVRCAQQQESEQAVSEVVQKNNG